MTPRPKADQTDDGSAVVLFDLDGVLTRRDTMGDLVIGQLRRSPLRLLAALPAALLTQALPAQHPWVPRLNRALVWLALRGVSPDGYRALASDTAHRLATRPGNVPTEAIAAVHDAAQRGRTIVVTASENTLARQFLAAVGLPDVELIASSMHHHGARVSLGVHNVGAGKVTHLQQAGVDLTTATLYTDSPSDLPLARQVRATVLVNPTRKAHRTMTRDLPPQTTRTVRWD